MKYFLARLSYAIPSLVLASVTLVAVPVMAEDGGGSSATGSGASTPVSNSGPSSSDHTEAKTNVVPETVKPDIETEQETAAKNQGALLVAQLRQKSKQQPEDVRKTACETHKQGLVTKFASINTEMTAFNTKIDGFLTKAEDYQSKNSVTVANWSSLISAATSADAASDSSIAALRAVTPSVDCNNVSVAQGIATYKAAAMQARNDLHTYKTDVQAIVKAIMGAKAPAQGGQQ